MSDEIDLSKEEPQGDMAERRSRGEFVRGTSEFRHAIEREGEFPAQEGRYHLYVALNCPWCHRVTLARNLLGLMDSVSMDVVYPNRTDEEDPDGPNLWQFAPERPSHTGQPLSECTSETATGLGLRLIAQVYAREGSSERSVPVLYDKKTQRIVSNESAEIIRMLGHHAEALGSTLAPEKIPSLYPRGEDHAPLRREIDELNEFIYVSINNGSYKAGFSSSQHVYDEAFARYFEALKDLEARLGADGRPFLTGERFTEADLRLFPTLYRHDPIYYVRMKLNGARLLDYPNLWRWLCRVYAMEGVAESSSMLHCRQGYFGRSWNRTIPAGPLRPMPYPKAYQHPELASGG